MAGLLIAVAMVTNLSFTYSDSRGIHARPPLEVRYVDGRREAFEILAARYHLRGELRKPHRLLDDRTGVRKYELCASVQH